MKAAVVETHGEPPVFQDHDDPAPADGQELVDVELAGINPIDLAIASGNFDAGAPPLPYIAGREGIGTTGSGQRIWFDAPMFPFGSMAERVPVAAGTSFQVPADISSSDAIAFGIAGMAAWLALEWRGQVKPGESVLILGASGSVGQIATQAARILGAGKVVGAARSEDGRTLVSGLGADAVVDTDPAQLTGAVQEASGGGVDLIIDNLWGEPAAAALLALNVSGRLVQVGNSAGTDSALKAGPLRGTAASILGHRNFHAPREIQQEAFENLCRHSVGGEIRIEVETVPLADVADAWERQSKSPGHKLALAP